jgi:hypothetical protein
MIMRKVFLFLVAAVLTASSAMAQIGIQAGLTRSNYWGSDAPKSSLTNGIQLGMVMVAPLIQKSMFKNFSYQTGFLFSQKGGEVVNAFGEKNHIIMTMNFLHISLYPRYIIDFGGGTGVFFQTGPYFGYAISGKQKNKVGGEWESDKLDFGARNMQRFDVGMGLGAGLQIVNNFQLCVGKNWSFMPLVESPAGWVNFYNTNLELTLTYLFDF